MDPMLVMHCEVGLTADQALTWCLTDPVGNIENISLGSHGSLDVIIEKDFACLDRSDKDNKDTFANPHARTTC